MKKQPSLIVEEKGGQKSELEIVGYKGFACRWNFACCQRKSNVELPWHANAL